MKMKNLTRAVVLVLLMSVLFASFCGCERNIGNEDTDNTEPTPVDSSDTIVESNTDLRWDTVIDNDRANFSQLKIEKYIAPGMASSIARIPDPITIADEGEINSILNSITEKDVTFEKISGDAEGFSDHINSHAHKEVIELIIIDESGSEVLGISVYEDGYVDVTKSIELGEEDRESLVYAYHAFGGNDIFEFLNSVYKNY